jgi:hypothetical protein
VSRLTHRYIGAGELEAAGALALVALAELPETGLRRIGLVSTVSTVPKASDYAEDDAGSIIEWGSKLNTATNSPHILTPL